MSAGMTNNMSPMTVVNAEVVLQVADDGQHRTPEEASFTDWVLAVAEHCERDLEVTVRIVTAEESRQLNRDYRGKDAPTNVLSFPFEAPPGLDLASAFIGDLALCAEVIHREAAQQDKPVTNHWAHMTIHGTLHLLGYDHQTDDEADIMEALETTLLGQHDIPDPYAIPGDAEH